MSLKKTKITNAALHVTMSDGSVWAILVWDIAYHRAEYYAKDFDGDVIRSLNEDTIPLFEGDEFEIRDWAANNMDWKDFNVTLVSPAPKPDYQDEWGDNDDKVVVYDE